MFPAVPPLTAAAAREIVAMLRLATGGHEVAVGSIRTVLGTPAACAAQIVLDFHARPCTGRLSTAPPCSLSRALRPAECPSWTAPATARAAHRGGRGQGTATAVRHPTRRVLVCEGERTHLLVDGTLALAQVLSDGGQHAVRVRRVGVRVVGVQLCESLNSLNRR